MRGRGIPYEVKYFSLSFPDVACHMVFAGVSTLAGKTEKH